MILSGSEILCRNILNPVLTEPVVHAETGLTGGPGPASYDVHIDQDITLWPRKGVVLASTVEHFEMPDDVAGDVKEKSTLVRQGLFVQNTYIDPGWRGYLTLELTYEGLAGGNPEPLHLVRGQPIAQIKFGLVLGAATPYSGKKPGDG